MFFDQLHSGFIRLADGGRDILLAVSGGRDSMALLHGAATLHRCFEPAAIVVAHLNHGLRGASGHRDAELVRSTSRDLGLQVVISECEPGELSRSSKGSLEESARNARYEFLRRTAVEHGLSFVATAHHAGDQAETILHNILRGTGLRGLVGIPQRRPLGDSVTLIRPMLEILPETIAEYITESGIVFFDDASNSDQEFTRNRIRNQLLPSLRSEFNPKVDESLFRLSHQTGELLDCLDALSNQILHQSILEQTPVICRLDRERLLKWPEPLIRHALTMLWSRVVWPRQQMTSGHWSRLTDITVKGGQQSLDLPGRLRFSCSGNVVRIERFTAAQRASE